MQFLDIVYASKDVSEMVHACKMWLDHHRQTHTYTHTHTQREREREREREAGSGASRKREQTIGNVKVS